MESSIFTPTVIAAINEFVESKLFDNIISDFDVETYSSFSKAVQDAESGQIEFEVEIEIDQMEDPDVFEQVMSKFFEGYRFGRDYRYLVGLSMSLDKEANDLSVTAELVLGSFSGLTSNGDEFVVYDGGTQLLEDYVEDNLEDWEDESGREIDYEDARERAREQFTDADSFNPANTSVTTVISLEN